MAGRSFNANEASTRKIELATKGRKTNFTEKLAMVASYVRTQAAIQQCDVDDVPCPDRNEWAVLASGRGAVLPNESQLRLYATDPMRRLAKQLGNNMREAYMATAKYRVKEARKA